MAKRTNVSSNLGFKKRLNTEEKLLETYSFLYFLLFKYANLYYGYKETA